MNQTIGFIFDLDGTLINSTNIGKIIEKKVSEKFNIEMNEKIQSEIDSLIYELIQGENHKKLGTKIMNEIFKKLGLNLFQRVRALMLASRIFKQEIAKIKLYEGVEELFEFFDENSFPYSIATTSSRKEVNDRLLKFPRFYEKFENKIITRNDVKNLKPNPESIKKASQIMNVPLARCVMVGDMHTDIIMGNSVGSVTIGVLTGIFTKEAFQKLNPDFIFTSVAEIPKNLDKIIEKLNHK